MGWSTIPKIITGVKALSKIKGGKTVSEWKNKASLSKFKATGFEVGQKLKKKFQKTATELNKLNKTIKDQQKILDK